MGAGADLEALPEERAVDFAVVVEQHPEMNRVALRAARSDSALS